MDNWRYFALTGAIWLGGAGIVVVGGLYTRWGTTLGAYAALIGGSSVAVTGFLLKYFNVRWMVDGEYCSLPKYMTGQWIYFWAILTAIFLYTVCSKLGKRQYFNLEKLLNRGKYRVCENYISDGRVENASPDKKRWTWKQAFGITNEFSKGDKFIYYVSIGQLILLLITFVSMVFLHLIFHLNDYQWSIYHRYMLKLWISTSFIIAIWLAIGGFKDAIQMYKDLDKRQSDLSDDGIVRDHDYNQDKTSSELARKKAHEIQCRT
jgi:SSS family solute:Na+ symporter